MEDTTFMKTVNNKSLYGTGNVHMTSFVSVADSAYYLTPAESTTSLKLAGDIILVDAKKLKGTTFSDSFIQFNANGNTRIKANDNVILGYGTTLTINNSGDSTFAGDVTIGSTGAASDKTLSIITGGTNSSIKLMEAGNLYGFSQVYDGVNNQFFIKRHSNSASGSAVVTMNRDNDTITLAGNLSSTASTVHFSLANMSAYQLNGTYVMDSSRNLVNIGNFTGGS